MGKLEEERTPAVVNDSVADIVSSWTKIPVRSLRRIPKTKS